MENIGCIKELTAVYAEFQAIHVGATLNPKPQTLNPSGFWSFTTLQSLEVAVQGF